MKRLSQCTSFKISWLIILAVSFIPKFGFSEKLDTKHTVDSLLAYLNETLYIDSLRMETREKAYETLAMSYEQDSDSLKAEAHALISTWYNYYNYNAEGSADSLTIYHETKAQEIYQKQGRSGDVATSHRYISLAYSGMQDYDKAITHALEAVNHYEKEGDQAGIGKAYKTLCGTYSSMEDHENTIKYGLKSNELLHPVDENTGDICINAFKMVRAYAALGQGKKGLDHANYALQLMKDYNMMNEEGLLARMAGARGASHQQMGNYDEAISDFQWAWEIVKGVVGDDVIRSDSWRDEIGNVLLISGRYQEALPHLEAAVHAYEVHQSNSLWVTYEQLKSCYEKLGDFQNAYIYSEKIKTQRDSLYEKRIKTLEAEAVIKYETGKKDEALAMKDIELAQQKRIQLLSFGGLGLLLTLLGGLFYNYRKNQQFSKELRLLNDNLKLRNQENELLLKEIHHRVKNNLQVISSLLNFQARSIKDKNAKGAILDSQSRVRSMSLIHQKLYRGANLAAIEMKNYLDILSESLVESYSDEELIDIKISMDNLELDVDYAIPIGLITNELVTNSLKYAFPNNQQGTIKIQLSKFDNELVLEISDNGAGGSEIGKTEKGGGFGSELVEMLTMQLKGAFSQSSENGYHTSLRIPYNKAA